MPRPTPLLLIALSACWLAAPGCRSRTAPPPPTGPKVDQTRATFATFRGLLDRYHAQTGHWPEGPTMIEALAQLQAAGLRMPDAPVVPPGDPPSPVDDAWGYHIGYYTGKGPSTPALAQRYRQAGDDKPMLVSAGPNHRFGDADDLYDP
jgi:hypothetical protein